MCGVIKSLSACCLSIICCFFAMAIVGGVLIYIYTNGEPGELFTFQDPPGLNSTNHWDTNGNYYLQLEVLNSLEDKYVPAFEEFAQRWDNGSPDVLELTVTRMNPDTSCQTYDGKLNFCNNDFGRTDWRGIAELFIVEGFVLHGVAKMNDFFLDDEGEIWRRYTMCHEMGHGFGLPHTDENYYNIDRGDCMDYTLRPRNNLDPGEYNFKLLEQMYGSPDKRNYTLSGGSVSDTGVFPGSDTIKDWFDLDGDNTTDANSDATGNDDDSNAAGNDDSNNGFGEDSGGNRRRLVTQEVMTKYHIAMKGIEDNNLDELADWGINITQKGLHGEEFEAELGPGCKIQVHKLLVQY